MQKARTMEALERLAGGTAHDLNNLLTVITRDTECLADQTRDVPATAVPLAQIESAVERATELMQRLTAFSHGQPKTTRKVVISI